MNRFHAESMVKSIRPSGRVEGILFHPAAQPLKGLRGGINSSQALPMPAFWARNEFIPRGINGEIKRGGEAVLRGLRIDYVDEARKALARMREEKAAMDERSAGAAATEAAQGFQARQVYRLPEMAEVFKVATTTVGRREGSRIPARWGGALNSNPVWRKADVWDHLGLDRGDLPGLSAGTFLSTTRAALMFGISAESFIQAVKRRGIPYQDVDGAGFIFAATTIEDLLGHAPVAWPKQGDDPAFTAVAKPDPAPRPAPTANVIAGRIDGATIEEIVRKVVREEVGLQMTSGAFRISRSDIAALGDEVRNVCREFVANRPYQVPPTTSLRDRARGVGGS